MKLRNIARATVYVPNILCGLRLLVKSPAWLEFGLKFQEIKKGVSERKGSGSVATLWIYLQQSPIMANSNKIKMSLSRAFMGITLMLKFKRLKQDLSGHR
jgi:hypothetical protein